MAVRRDGPLIVQSDRTVLLDCHHGKAEEVREVLGSFAELLKSPDNLHTYRISSLSLWNAAAAGLSPAEVVEFLDSYSMHPLPRPLSGQIEEIMGRFGRLLLRRDQDGLVLWVSEDLWDDVIGLDSLTELVTHRDDEAHELRIDDGARGVLKRALVRAGYPVEDLAGYVEGDALDFDLATELPDGSPFELRSYQSGAAQAFFQDGDLRGGNGVVVLPCGAGKTVTAMGVMALYRTKTLILTNSTTAVRQWIRELREKTNLPDDAIGEYSAEVKEIAPVTVTTYQMLTWRSTKLGGFPHFAAFMEVNWGLVVYDEVHLFTSPPSWK